MRLICLVLLAGVCAQAQDSQPAPPILPKRTQRIVTVKNPDLFVGGGGFQHAYEVAIVSTPGHLVISGNEPNVIAAEQAIARLDTTPRNLELTFQILAASPQASTEKAPSDLDGVIKQLRSSFVYQGYHLIDTAFVRTREGGKVATNGALAGGRERFYNIRIESVDLQKGDPASLIRVNRLEFHARFPMTVGPELQKQFADANISASIDIRVGQKAVVGKANLEDKEGAVFLVVSAKVVD